MAARDIARRLQVSRSTVSIIIARRARAVGGALGQAGNRPGTTAAAVRAVRGLGVRVHEKLQEEEGIKVAYPTLTRCCGRWHQHSRPTTLRPGARRAGKEMQHDTSPYWIALGGVKVRLNASLLYLRYSKRRYLRFYRAFNRFRMKCFLHEA